jgi:hypothetical protein
MIGTRVRETRLPPPTLVDGAPDARRGAPPLSPAHGTSLATTAGITAVITVVAAVSVLAQTAALAGVRALLAQLAVAALLLGAGGLYLGRNHIGRALDLAADPRAAAIAAARGLARFHLGMAGVFAGAGLAAATRLTGALGWIAPAAGGLLAAIALVRSLGWMIEARRR